LLTAVVGTLALGGCSMHHDAPATQPVSSEMGNGAIAAIDMKNTVCPVSGDKVGDSTEVVIYDGKVYHMCCPDCHKEFMKDPQKYSAAVAADPAKYGVKS